MTWNLAHIAQLSGFDRLFHEEEHVSTLEGFGFEKLLGKGEAEEKKVRSKHDLIEWLRKSGEKWAELLEDLPEGLLAEQMVQVPRRIKDSFRDDSRLLRKLTRSAVQIRHGAIHQRDNETGL